MYNTAFGVIKQQNRNGANMAVMSGTCAAPGRPLPISDVCVFVCLCVLVSHPDILEFVHCKDVEGALRNFNVSVGLTGEFMRRVESNDPRPWMWYVFCSLFVVGSFPFFLVLLA